MDNNQLLSIIIVSFKRFDDLSECLKSIRNNLFAPQHIEIIVIDNACMDPCRVICEQYGAKYINSGANLGVSGGRNLGIKLSRGELLFFIDDDAEVATLGFDSMIRKYLQGATAVLAFRVLSYFNGTPNPGELPFRWKAEAEIEQSRQVSYFVGAAFALNRKLIHEIGDFQDDFFYGAEELEFSYRVLMHHQVIYYLADLTILHKKSAIRITNKICYYHTLRNRFVIEARYIPFPYCVFNLVFWSTVMFFGSFRDRAVRQWGRGLIKGCSEFPQERRNGALLDRKTINYLKVNHGRLWY